MAASTGINTRSAQTREALLAGALEVFGRDGFHAASTRAIAEAAGVNQALISYHFGGKEGLYLAVFATITDSLTEHVGPMLELMRAEIDSLEGSTPEGRRQCLAYMDQLMTGSMNVLYQPQAIGWVKLVMREQQDPGEAFDIFYGGIYGDMLEMMTRLVAKLTDRSPRDEGARMLTLTLIGQMIIFLVMRATTTRHLGWRDVGENQLRKVHEQVREGLYTRFGEEVPA